MQTLNGPHHTAGLIGKLPRGPEELHRGADGERRLNKPGPEQNQGQQRERKRESIAYGHDGRLARQQGQGTNQRIKFGGGGEQLWGDAHAGHPRRINRHGEDLEPVH